MHTADPNLITSGNLFDELKNAQRLSREYNELLDVLPDIIYKLDPEGRFVYLSKAIAILRYTPEELIGKHFSTIVHPDDVPRVSRNIVLQRYRSRAAGAAGMPKLFDERRTGERVTKNLVVRMIPKGGAAGNGGTDIFAFRSEICATGQYQGPGGETDPEGKPEMAARLQSEPEPEREFYGEISTYGKYDDDAHPKRKFEGTVGVIRDISDRTWLEQEKFKLETRLLLSQKMEAIGTLAGGVAHDLNNILGVLVGYSELLQEKIPAESPLRRYVDNILRSGMKGANIIQDLLTLAGRGMAVSSVVNLNKVVSDYMGSPDFDNLRINHPSVAFKTDMAGDLLNIKGSPMPLGKMVMKLVSNAVEAISNRGMVTIQTWNCYVDRPIGRYDDVREGDYAVLKVTDTGRGIPGKDIDRIFEPFYTKKKMGRSGTGLGLAVVWGTLKDHRGYIDVQSTEGEGSAFTLYFPVTRETLGKDRQAVAPDVLIGRGESILVVDDVMEQRELAVSMLTSLGYRVSAVSSGEEALDYLKANKADLLVLDMIMDPGMDGLETYQRILEIIPEQKAIIVSGYSETARVKKAQELGAGAYVRKPYVMEKIGRSIRDELNK